VNRGVRFLPAARREIEEAFLWYEAKTPGLGVSFRAEVDRQLARMSDHPLQFPLVKTDMRRARMRRFPYGLFFKIDGDDVFVIACFHASRNPRSWQDRV